MYGCLRKEWHRRGFGGIGGLIIPWGSALGRYPYADGAGGYAIDAIDDDGEVRGQQVRLRLEGDAGYVLLGAGRAALGARVELPHVFVDFVTRYSLYVEPEDSGAVVIALGYTGADLRLFDAEGIQLRLGGRFVHFQDELGGVFGGGIHLGADFYFVAPLVISAEVTLAIVGDALAVAARAEIGFLVEGTEIFGGYHYEGLGSGPDTVDLGGPMLGIRQWF